MITVGMNYHVIAGKQADFESKFSAFSLPLVTPPAIPIPSYSKTWPTIAPI